MERISASRPRARPFLADSSSMQVYGTVRRHRWQVTIGLDLAAGLTSAWAGLKSQMVARKRPERIVGPVAAGSTGKNFYPGSSENSVGRAYAP